MTDARQIRIVKHQPEYATAFAALNRAWLERYFAVEPIDEKILSAPDQVITAGGQILYAVYREEVLGCCALKHHGQGIFELTKMAVTDSAQGLGIGQRLAKSVLAYFLELNGQHLFLESHSSLIPALKLYEKLGFVHTDPPQPSPYSRSDIYMVWQPTKDQARDL